MYSVPEYTKSQDDRKEALMAIAKELNVSIDKPVGNQRAHR